MIRVLRNVYLWIFGIPAALFGFLVAFSVNTDDINLVSRIFAVGLVGYIAARYIWRSVFLIKDNDTSPEAFNLVGWATFLVAYILITAYGAISIAMDRPAWLTSLYYSSAFVVLAVVGAAMVAWSIPRVGIFPNDQKGISGLAAFIVGAGIMFFATHAPAVMSFLRGLFGSVVRAF